MIDKNKERNAVAAIQAVFIALRTLAFERVDHALMAEALDSAEYLPCLMLEEEDVTKIFGATLQHLASLHPSFNRAVERFEHAI